MMWEVLSESSTCQSITRETIRDMELMGMMRAVEMITYKMYAMKNVSLEVFEVKGLINSVCVVR